MLTVLYKSTPKSLLIGIIYQIDARLWRKYFAVFRHAWAASAFKGAFGERLLLPDLRRHAANNAAWVDVVQARQGRIINSFYLFSNLIYLFICFINSIYYAAGKRCGQEEQLLPRHRPHRLVEVRPLRRPLRTGELDPK